MNINDSTIQLRVDKKTKEKAKSVLNEIGLDFYSAIKIFLKRVIATESIPFEIRTENGFTIKQEEKMIKETKNAIKSVKRYSSAEKLHKVLTS